MATHARKGTEEEWREIGELVQAARDAIVELIECPAFGEMLPANVVNRMALIKNRFEDVARDIEYQMFRRGGPRDLSVMETNFGKE